jgi:hypothetical protein
MGASGPRRCVRAGGRRLFLLAFALLGSASPLAQADCLAYDPSSVVVAGTLERRTYPGRPNVESVAGGDEPETGFYLVLSKAVCTNANAANPESFKDVRLVQLLLDSKGYEMLRPSLGRTVRLTGRLMGRITAHHHAPLLLEFERESPAL